MTAKVVSGLGKFFGKTKNFVHIFYSFPIILLLLSILFVVFKIAIIATILYIAATLLLLMILPILGYGKSEYVKIESSE